MNAKDIEGRYSVVRQGYWWRVVIGDGQQVIGKCYTETEAQRLAAALLTAFRDREFFAQTELQGEIESLHQQLAAKQAEVDALMLEYCSSAMSQEQLDNWAAHQRPVEEN